MFEAGWDLFWQFHEAIISSFRPFFWFKLGSSENVLSGLKFKYMATPKEVESLLGQLGVGYTLSEFEEMMRSAGRLPISKVKTLFLNELGSRNNTLGIDTVSGRDDPYFSDDPEVHNAAVNGTLNKLGLPHFL